jgi:5-methylcytosine-specific restriction endonuclease McrA
MGVLLLNASYEAIRIIPLHRAVILVLQEQAEIVEAGEGDIRSQHVSLPRPEVIRLKYFVKIPYRSRVPLSNRAVLNRDKYTCAYCGKRASTVDHVHPKAKGGKHEWTNVVAACKGCNSKKADKTLEQMGWTLSFKPEAPHAKTWIVVGSPEKAEEWSEWLKTA